MNYLFSNQALKKLIIPLVLEQALAITVGMVDTVMISSVGEAAVSGVSLVDMLNVLIFNLLAALSTGGSVVVSQNIGAGKLHDARKTAKQLLFSVIIFSTTLSILIILFRTSVLRLFFGQIEADVMTAALTYISISTISFPFLGIYNSCAALFRSMGKANVTFIVSILGNAINVLGNAFCIFVLKMEVAGVALPTLVSRVVMAIILYILLRNPELQIHFECDKFHLDWGIIKKILYIGIPCSIENGLFQLGRVLVVSIISTFGTIQIAANGIANNLDSIGIIVGQAMNLAMITVIGTCVGAGDQKQIQYYMKKLIAITYIATAVVNIILLLNLGPILSIYGVGPETTQLAYKLVMIHNGFAIFLWPLSFVFPNMLRACNDVRYTMFVSIFSMCIFRIGFSLILGIRMEMGAIGVWIAMVIDWVFRMILFIGRYWHGDWKKSMYKLK